MLPTGPAQTPGGLNGWRSRSCFCNRWSKPTQAESAAPVVFAPKNDGILHFCRYFRILKPKRDSDLLPCMEECIGTFGKVAVCFTLVANSGYRFVEGDGIHADNSVFTSYIELYRFVDKPFELKNAPGLFQLFHRTLHVILSPMIWQYALVFLDDTVVLLRFQNKHITKLWKALNPLKNAGVTLKLKNCSFVPEFII